jgi:pimeloyl-ACP methyl ester carboxylesterase
VTIGGHRVFYSRTGRGRPLVLAHGYLVSHWEFRHVIPVLAQDHDVIAFDLPGFGESDRPDVTAYHYDAAAFVETLVGLLDALSIDRATLIGHSMGGGVALYAAARRPERVERLVVVDPLVYPWELPWMGRLALTPFLGATLFRSVANRALVRRRMKQDIYHDPSVVTDDWVDYVWERMNRPGGLEAAVAALRFVADPRAIARSVRAVRAPTLIVWGENDRLFPSTNAGRLALDIAGSETQIIPVCGHSPPEERPRALLDVLLPFLGSTSRRAIA